MLTGQAVVPLTKGLEMGWIGKSSPRTTQEDSNGQCRQEKFRALDGNAASTSKAVSYKPEKSDTNEGAAS